MKKNFLTAFVFMLSANVGAETWVCNFADEFHAFKREGEKICKLVQTMSSGYEFCYPILVENKDYLLLHRNKKGVPELVILFKQLGAMRMVMIDALGREYFTDHDCKIK